VRQLGPAAGQAPVAQAEDGKEEPDETDA